MPKLSEYINLVEARRHLAVCIESVHHRQGGRAVMMVHFENSKGFKSQVTPNDVGLPAIVSKFDRE